jgi:hypothetical protein
VYSKAKTISFGLLAIIISLDRVDAAEIKFSAAKDGRVSVTIVGDIMPGDAEAFSQAVKQANDAGKFVANIRLNSNGGNLLEGVKLADAVRFGKMSTNVGKQATCASACFLVFAAGATKFASYGAQIGVHGASDETGRETVSSEAATVSMAKIAKELGVPSAIIGRMVVTPPSEMVWLSPDELQSMGVTMVGKPAQTAVGSPSPSIDSGQVARLPPQQTRPSDPMDLSPSAKSSRSPPTWDGLVEKSVALSAQQNGGNAQTFRACQPEFKTCFNAVMFKLDVVETIAKVTRDMNDRIIRRELCSFNPSGDIRICLDWDTQRTHRDMQDSKGNWSKIADE